MFHWRVREAPFTIQRFETAFSRSQAGVQGRNAAPVSVYMWGLLTIRGSVSSSRRSVEHNLAALAGEHGIKALLEIGVVEAVSDHRFDVQGEVALLEFLSFPSWSLGTRADFFSIVVSNGLGISQWTESVQVEFSRVTTLTDRPCRVTEDTHFGRGQARRAKWGREFFRRNAAYPLAHMKFTAQEQTQRVRVENPKTQGSVSGTSRLWR